MGAKTNIRWADSTWNPIRARHRVTGKVGWHCQHASSGCINCYAEELNIRLGTGERFIATSPVDLFLDDEVMEQALRWKRSRKIFLCSMTDLFGEFVPDEWLDRIFREILECLLQHRSHVFQVLTKRAERMRGYFEKRPEFARLSNVWLGVSVEDQRTADERTPLLLQTPAAVRWLSVEPILEHIDLGTWFFSAMTDAGRCACDWVVVGGESGKHRRECDPAWIVSIMEQCRAAGVSCWVKQDSALRPGQQGRLPDEIWATKEFPGR